MRESAFERHVVQRLYDEFPGCVVLKLDSSLTQGIPDRLVLFGPAWGSLEIKRSKTAPFQPNQEHYIRVLDEMSFAAVIYPENEDEVFDALQHALKPRRYSRVSQRQ